MHKLTFHNLGNADCCRIDLANGKKLLVDYAAVADPDDQSDRRVDLERSLRDDLEAADRDYYDVVAFTHLDRDHVHGSADFFHLDHAKKYQGEGRVKIRDLWVPATAIYDEDCEGDARVIREEAQHRLREGYGIRVFSRPQRLEEWLNRQGLSLESRRAFITDAGQVVPGLTLADDDVEIFLHSPFAFRTDQGELIDRNGSSIVVQAAFHRGGRTTKLLLGADVTHDEITDFVTMTRRHGNDDRLESDVVKIPHHTSYTAIGPDKGTDRTQPVPNVKWLYEEQMRWGAIMVSSSRPIPGADDDDGPPHRQAAAYYRDVVGSRGGEFIVTMEHPTEPDPRPVVIKIDGFGPRLEKTVPSAVAAITGTAAPRAGG
jgi:hypothetical protein